MPVLSTDAERDRLLVKDAFRDQFKPEVGPVYQKLVDRACLLEALTSGRNDRAPGAPDILADDVHELVKIDDGAFTQPWPEGVEDKLRAGVEIVVYVDV
jgi:hypothetical protein